MYDRNNDVERIFYEEVREKKVIGYGAYHNSGKRGTRGVKKLMFASDFMSAKEKRLYMKGGEVMESNIYDNLENIPSLDELGKMDFEKAKDIIDRTKTKFGIKKSLKHWGISQYVFYNKVLVKYGLAKPFPSASKGYKNDHVVNKNNRKNNAKENIEKIDSTPVQQVIGGQQQIVTYIPEKKELGMKISFADESLLPDYIESRILGILGAMDKGKKYNISFELQEIKE